MDFESHIPMEILDVILEKLGEDLCSSSKGSYVDLMLVCKRWHVVAQKRILHNIDMPNTFVWSKGDSRSFQFYRALDFLWLLRKRPDLAALVKIAHWTEPSPSVILNSVFAPNGFAQHFFNLVTNLVDLSIITGGQTSETTASVVFPALPALEYLSYNACTARPVFLTTFPKLHQSKHLQTLVLEGHIQLPDQSVVIEPPTSPDLGTLFMNASVHFATISKVLFGKLGGSLRSLNASLVWSSWDECVTFITALKGTLQHVALLFVDDWPNGQVSSLDASLPLLPHLRTLRIEIPVECHELSYQDVAPHIFQHPQLEKISTHGLEFEGTGEDWHESSLQRLRSFSVTSQNINPHFLARMLLPCSNLEIIELFYFMEYEEEVTKYNQLIEILSQSSLAPTLTVNLSFTYLYATGAYRYPIANAFSSSKFWINFHRVALFFLHHAPLAAKVVYLELVNMLSLGNGCLQYLELQLTHFVPTLFSYDFDDNDADGIIDFLLSLSNVLSNSRCLPRLRQLTLVVFVQGTKVDEWQATPGVVDATAALQRVFENRSAEFQIQFRSG